MAKSTGKFGALSQLQPLQGDIATDILNREDQQFKHREEKRINEDRASAKKLAEKKSLDDAIGKAKALNLYDTESSSMNEVVAKAIMMGVEEQTRLIPIIENKDGKYSRDEVIKANLEMDAINALPDNLKIMTGGLTEEYTTHKQLVAEGKEWDDPEYENKFAKGFEGVSIVIKNGKPVTIFKQGTIDADGDGVLDFETMESLGDVNKRPQFLARHDYNNTVLAHSKRIAEEVNKIVGKDGYSTIETTGIQEEMLQKTVKGALYDANGNPTGQMKSFIRENNLDANNPEHLKQIESKYENDLRISIKRGEKVDPNNSDKISAGHLAIARNADARAAKKETTTTTTSPFTLSVDEKGRELTVVKDAGAIKKGYSQFTIPKENRKSLVINGIYTEIDEVYRDPKSGKLSFGGWEQVLKDGVWTNTKRTSGTLSEGSKIATELGYDVQELSTELGRVRQEKLSGKATKKTIASSEIADKASAGGYTVEEYKKLLIANGIEITE